MLEKVVEKLLNRYLAPYVDGISKDGLSILQGNLEFKDLAIKKDALDGLKKSGINLRTGRIGRILVQIPWRNLSNARISIELSDVTVDVSRIVGEAPGEEQILSEFRAAKQRTIERKLRELQSLAEAADHLGQQANKGIVARWCHRLAQNLQVKVDGGVLARCADPESGICGGMLLAGLQVHSQGADASRTESGVLHKVCEVSDLALFVEVAGAPVRYLLEPTSVALHIDHEEKRLGVKLDIAEENTSLRGITISRAALFHAAAAVRAVMAWQKHVTEVVSSHGQGVKIDAESLEGETKDEYMRLHRERLLEEKWRAQAEASPSRLSRPGHALYEQSSSDEESGEDDAEPRSPMKRQSSTDLTRLQAMEDMVPSRILARWQLAVLTQIESAKGLGGGAAAKGGGFFGWFRKRDDQKQSDIMLEKEDWDALQKQVQEAQAGLGDLAVPTVMDLEFKVMLFRVHCFDDGTPLLSDGMGEHVRDMQAEVSYAMLQNELHKSLDMEDEMKIHNQFNIRINHFQARASTLSRVVSDVEKKEWTFGIQVGTVNMSCNGDVALHYMGGELASATPAGLATAYKDYITLSSKIQDDGSELLSVEVTLPPLELAASPDMVRAVKSLVAFTLPPPPVYTVIGRSTTPVQTEASFATLSEEAAPVSQVQDWRHDLEAWRENQNTRIKQMAKAQVERVQENVLKLNINISIEAPKLTIHSEKCKATQVIIEGKSLPVTAPMVQVDLGQLNVKSNGIITMHKFDLHFNLKKTQVTCLLVEDGSTVSEHHVLKPINFEVTLNGGQGASVAGVQPLDLNVGARLQPLLVTLSPKTVQFAHALPVAFNEALGIQERPRAVSMTAPTHRGSKRASLLAMPMGATLSKAGTESAAVAGMMLEKKKHAEEPQRLALSLQAAIEKVSLTMMGEDGFQVLSAQVVKVETEVVLKRDTSQEISLRMQQFNVDARRDPLVQMMRSAEDQRWEALTVSIVKPAGPPMKINANVCPVRVAWRKSSVEAIVRTLKAYQPPTRPNHVAGGAAKEIALGGKLGDVVSSIKVARPRSAVDAADAFVAEDVEGTDLVRTGLTASGALPPLRAANSPKALILDMSFGGLHVDLHCEDDGDPRLHTCWQATSQSPLIQLLSLGTTFHLESHANGEASGKGQLSTLRLVYDGQAILEPCQDSTSFFEYDFCIYLPREKEGPMHSICFRALLRSIRHVFFLKHVDSFVYYLQNHIVKAIGQDAAQEVKDKAVAQAAEGVVKNVAEKKPSFLLWNIHMETPVIYWGRDEEVLREARRAAGASQGDKKKGRARRSTVRKSVKRASIQQPQQENPQGDDVIQSDTADGFDDDDDDFEDAIESEEEENVPSMVSSLREFFEIYPGSVSVSNSFDLDAVESTPPRYTMQIHDCEGKFVDKEAGTSGVVVDKFSWELVVRTDFGKPADPLHVSLGLNYYCPIIVNVQPQVYLLFLNCLNENCAYSRYFPTGAPPAQAPEGALQADTLLEVHTGQSSSNEAPAQFESIRLNARADFKQLRVNASYLSDNYPGGIAEIFRITKTDMRLTYDMFLYYGGAAPAFQVRGSMGAISVEDCRPFDFRRNVNSKCLECPKEQKAVAPAVTEDGWVLVVDREGGKMPYSPQSCALQVIFTKTSRNESKLELSLRQPRVFVLQHFVNDLIAFVTVPLAASTLTSVQPPPPPMEDVDTDDESVTSDEAAGEPVLPFKYEVKVEGAEVCLYTECDNLEAPVIEIMGSVSASWSAWKSNMDFDDISATDWSIRRAEGLQGADVELPGRRGRTTVHVCQLSELRMAGKLLKEDRVQPELNVAVHCRPLVVCLTTLDIPHLNAAITALGSDGKGGGMAARFPLDTSMAMSDAGQEKESAAGVSAAQWSKRLPPPVTVTHSPTDVGKLRLVVLGLSASEASGAPVKGMQNFYVTVAMGSDWEMPAAIGHDLLLPVPGTVNRLGMQRGAFVNMTLYRGGDLEEVVGRLRFPVEVCAGPGLNVRRKFRLERGTSNLNELAVAEVSFKASYEPKDAKAAVVSCVTAIAAVDQTVEDFLAPVQSLSDFLGCDVPNFPKLRTARQSMMRPRASLAWATFQPPDVASEPMAIRLCASIEGLEASFLDDCHAAILPVLRLSLKAKQRRAENGIGAALEAVSRGEHTLGEGGVVFLQNVPGGEQLQGTILRVEDCTFSMDYLNARAGLWEPVLEKWTFDFFFSQGYVDGGLLPTRSRSQADTVSDEKYKSRVDIALASFSALRINITPQLCSLAAIFLNSKEEYLANLRRHPGAPASPSAQDKEITAAGARYRLLNLTGLPLQLAFFWPNEESQCEHGDGSMSQEDGRWHVFEPCAGEVGLDPYLGQRTTDSLRNSADAELACELALVGGTCSTMMLLSSTCDSTLPIPPAFLSEANASFRESTFTTASFSVAEDTNRAAATGLRRTFSGGLGDPNIIACHVFTPHPSHKVLLVSSAVRIFNHLQWPMEVRFGVAVPAEAKGGGDPAEGRRPIEEANAGPGIQMSCIRKSQPDSQQASPLLGRDSSAGSASSPARISVQEVDNVAPSRAAKPSLSALMDLLPERVAYPPEMAHILRAGGVDADIADGRAWHQATQAGTTALQSMVGPGSPLEDVDDLELRQASEAQHLPSRCFCPAPVDVVGNCNAFQLRVAGVEEWSQPVTMPSGSGANAVEKAILLYSQEGEHIHLQVRLSFDPLASSATSSAVLSAHVFSPLRVLNAAPVSLRFDFQVPASSLPGHHQSVEVPPFTCCDLPTSLSMPGSQAACGLSLAIADDDVDVEDAAASPLAEAERRPWRLSEMLPQIFNDEAGAEAVMHVPICREGDFMEMELAAEQSPKPKAKRQPLPSLQLMVDRGHAVRVTCSRWLIDRTGLGIRVVQGGKLVPRVGGYITLMNPGGSGKADTVSLVAPSSAGTSTAAGGRMAASANTLASHGWASEGQVKFPNRAGQFQHASLVSAESGTPIHVCLQAENVSQSMTLGASCQIISVLPQVIVYNELQADTLLVRAEEDGSIVRVEPKSSASIMQWKNKEPALQFRTTSLEGLAGWAVPLRHGTGDMGWRSILLPTLTSTGAASTSPEQRMFTVEVVEEVGVLCFTVRPGSLYEIQNFSQLVSKVRVWPSSAQAQNGLGDTVFEAETCESSPVAFSSPAVGGLQVELQWVEQAGGGTTTCSIKDLYAPSRQQHMTPGGWHAVAVEVGSSSDQCWLRVTDVPRRRMKEREPQHWMADLRVGLSLHHVGVSVVSLDREREALYASLGQVGFLLGVWDDARSIDMVIMDMQVDCQLMDFPDPVILASRGGNTTPWLKMHMTQQLPASTMGLVLPELRLQVDAMEVSVSQPLLQEIMATVDGLLRPFKLTSGVTKSQLEAWRTSPLDGSLSTPPAVPKRLTIKHLVVYGLEVHVWLSVCLKQFLSPKLYSFMNRFGLGDIRVQGARLRLANERFDGISDPMPKVMSDVLTRYWMSLLRSLGSVLGRNSLVEIPTLPVTWARQGVGRTMEGVSFVLTRATDVMQQLTLDQNYIRRRRRMQEEHYEQITGFRSGLGAAARHLALGIYHIGDVVRMPVEGCQEDGAHGFFVGLGQGILGTLVKPFVETGYSVRALAKAVSLKVKHRHVGRDVVLRQRPPRVVYSGTHIREYDEVSALLTLELATARVAEGSTRQTAAALNAARSSAVDHIVVKRGHHGAQHLLLLLTPTQLVLVDLRSHGSHATVSMQWAIPRAAYQGMQTSAEGITLKVEPNRGALASRASAAAGSGSRLSVQRQSTLISRSADSRGFFIPCEDDATFTTVRQALRPLQPLAGLGARN